MAFSFSLNQNNIICFSSYIAFYMDTHINGYTWDSNSQYDYYSQMFPNWLQKRKVKMDSAQFKSLRIVSQD